MACAGSHSLHGRKFGGTKGSVTLLSNTGGGGRVWLHWRAAPPLQSGCSTLPPYHPTNRVVKNMKKRDESPMRPKAVNSIDIVLCR